MSLTRRRCLLTAFAWVAVALPAVGVAATAGASPAATDPGLVRVREGRELLRDCTPWVPRGLSFFGRVIPRDWQAGDVSTAAAREAFGQWNIDAVKWLDGDVIRLQVGMPFLDPVSPQHTVGYLAEIRAATALARRQGLTVIISLQYQGRTNVKPVEYLPKASARRAWQVLGPAFASDLGVMYELFNEPASPPQPEPGQWEAWRVGHQTIINDLRSAGIANTVVVDGLNGAHTLRGAPALQDPLRQLIYAVHPYFRDNYLGPADWDLAFGSFAETHPVLVTEWGLASRQCSWGGDHAVQQLLSYLEQRRIGVIAYGADEQSSRLLLRRGKDFVATSFRNRECGSPGAGPGELLKDTFERATRLNAAARRVAPEACGLR